MCASSLGRFRKTHISVCKYNVDVSTHIQTQPEAEGMSQWEAAEPGHRVAEVLLLTLQLFLSLKYFKCS